jgi:hypothetical protein
MIFTGAARRTRTVTGSLEALGTRLLVPVVACAAIVACTELHEAGRRPRRESEAVNAVGVEIVSLTVLASPATA